MNAVKMLEYVDNINKLLFKNSDVKYVMLFNGFGYTFILRKGYDAIYSSPEYIKINKKIVKTELINMYTMLIKDLI